MIGGVYERKSDKLRAMLEKEKERRIKLNNRIEILERRIQEEDSAESTRWCGLQRSHRNSIAALLRQSATATRPGCAVCRGCNF